MVKYLMPHHFLNLEGPSIDVVDQTLNVTSHLSFLVDVQNILFIHVDISSMYSSIEYFTFLEDVPNILFIYVNIYSIYYSIAYSRECLMYTMPFITCVQYQVYTEIQLQEYMF
jgi:hypothetical protein